MPNPDAIPGYSARLSKHLPPSLGSLFGQPLDRVASRVTLPDPPANLPGAHASHELCCIVDQYIESLLPADAVAEVKLDGIRCLYIAGRLWTREGAPFEAAEHCLPILQAMEQDLRRPMFFDGEYIEEGGLERTNAAFRSRKGNGCLWLFDAVPFDEWKSGKASRYSLIERKTMLRCSLMAVTGGREGCPVGYIEHTAAGGTAGVEAKARDLWSLGYEGLVIKDPASRYVRRRSCDWMKVKLRTTSTMEIVDVVGCERKVEVCDPASPGARVFAMQEQAKALLVRMRGKDDRTGYHKPMRLPVPAGGLAETLWRRRNDLIGTTCQVEHAGFTGGGNPREPTLKAVTL